MVVKEYDLHGTGAHLQTYAAGPSSSKPFVIERYAKHLLAHIPAVGDRKAYREYINMIRQRTLFDSIIDTYPTLPKQYWAVTSISPHNITSQRLGTETFPTCAERLKKKYPSTVALNPFYRYWRRVLVPKYTSRALSKR